MSSALAGWLQLALLVAVLAACYVPLGNYIARIFTSEKHWRVERGIYKVIGVDSGADQKWSNYLRSMLAFSLISVLFLVRSMNRHLKKLPESFDPQHPEPDQAVDDGTIRQHPDDQPPHEPGG